MRRISPASIEFLPQIEKCLGRAEMDNRYRGIHDPSVEGFSSRLRMAIEEKHFLIEREGNVVLGAIETFHDDGKSFLGEGAREKDVYDLLEQIEYKGESLIAIEMIFVDPTMIGKGVGKELLAAVFAANKETSFLLQVDRNNARGIAFFQKNGFVLIPYPLGNPNNLFMAKPYVPQGLCRKAFW